MDTKWKNRKNTVSFIIFILGASLALGGLAGILRDKPSGVHFWQTDKLLQGDYQQNYRFQEYITGRFHTFLTIAMGGDLNRAWGYNGGYYDDYYGGDGGTSVWITETPEQDALEAMTEAYEQMELEWERLVAEGAAEEAAAYYEELRAYRQEIESYQEEMGLRQEEEPGESAEEEKKQTISRYLDKIKGDKNLLYTISYDGQMLYSNSQLLTADGQMTAPEGYSFLLYFDGEKVRIVKDGKELDVYGDGYYRESTSWRESRDWYVPGYRNFPVGEDMKKAAILMAAAGEPVLYIDGSYGNADSVQYDNSLYWMHYECQSRRKLLQKEAAYFAIGLLLLVVSFWGRKGRKEAEARFAGIQAKIWAECKALLLAGLLVLVFFLIKIGSQGYGLWRELAEGFYYDYEYGWSSLSDYGREILKNTHPMAWVVLFWGIWLVWNELKHNQKVWKRSLVGKLCRTFSAKSVSWTPAKKLAFRNNAVLAGVIIYILLLLVLAVQWTNGSGSRVMLALCTFFGTAGFLLLAYLTGEKNMETARDMETVSDCIREIRNGNYADIQGEFTGHDMEMLMTQIEDIRHGMEKAVEEQMKSQKMKVELIANVSHDIKTPLTSIISYVQFLKQEENLPEHVKDYVRILDEKSQRLKNMVQDVFAVSKAASGELPVHMEELDFGKLLCQTLADMEEQIENSEVSFRTELPKTPVMIRADGDRMYRVFQNLFQNAVQYSLAGSRVYVTLEEDQTTAVASVKNSSRMELDKEKDFAERFARGDQSRTDGGSGLGLSIAQSFTEACGGKFAWETDADLFIVKVSFTKLS